MPVPEISRSTYPARDGNRVRPLIDGIEAFGRICEAIESATTSVWATITFLHPKFVLPGGRGTLFDVLDSAARRGIDVRVLFWRHGPETEDFGPTVFWGSPDHRRFLADRASGIKIRWDRAAPGFCQHQKSWIIDAGTPTETAFVGGINGNPTAMAERGHPEAISTHDAYLEIAGPSATDVNHNFVQRWNEATERGRPDGYWPPAGNDDLTFPATASRHAGSSRVQIQRTIAPGELTDSHPAAGAARHPIDQGELSILEQYLAAIRSARRTIYLENQYVAEPTVIDALITACRLGVAVVAVIPLQQDRLSTSEVLSTLIAHPKFLLAGLTGRTVDGTRRDIYVHDKLMIVDEEWTTIGSANLHRYSLHGNAEINAGVWDPEVARALRISLFTEHLDSDTAALSDVDAITQFRETAAANRAHLDAGRSPAGLAVEFLVG